VDDRIDQFICDSHLLTLQNRGDRAGEMMPLLFILRRGLLPFRRQRIILPFTPVVCSTPFGLDLPLLLQLMQSGIQRAVLELERVGAPPRGFLQNFVAVHLPAREQIEQQQPDASLQKLRFDIHPPPHLAYQDFALHALYSKVSSAIALVNGKSARHRSVKCCTVPLRYRPYGSVSPRSDLLRKHAASPRSR